MWLKLTLGERWNIKDPATGKPATRNIYLGDAAKAGPTVKSLQARGAIAGFNPGVKLVPSHTMAVGLTQERGLTYEKL